MTHDYRHDSLSNVQIIKESVLRHTAEIKGIETWATVWFKCNSVASLVLNCLVRSNI